MGSFKFGRVADSLSQGLGLFAGHKAEEERARVKHQWDLELANLREQNATNRELRGYAHAEQQAHTASEAATARHEETQKRIVSEGELGRTERREQFDLDQVRRSEETLQDRIDVLREEQAEALENAFGIEGGEDAINRRYQGLRDDMILGHVIRLGEAGAPGYDINDAGALESKFIQNGMDTAGAKEHSANIGSQMWPAPKDPNAQSQFVPTGNVSYTEGPDQTPVVHGTGSPNVPQQTAAGSQPVNVVQPGSSLPAQGSDRNLFGHDMIRNPDGTPKFPMNREAPAVKAWDWFTGPSTEMFGKQ